MTPLRDPSPTTYADGTAFLRRPIDRRNKRWAPIVLIALIGLAGSSTVGTASTPPLVAGESVGLGLGTDLVLDLVVTGFDRPVDVEFRPRSPFMYVVEQGGTIWRVDPTGARSTFLDLRAQISSRGERGLLGLAFARDESDAVYVHYTDRRGDSVVSRFSVVADVADPASEVKLLQVAQPFANHNGGDLDIGPDGYLYASFGDGGSANDPLGAGRDLTTLLGKIVRIDVSGGDRGYVVPPDNPFSARGGMPEIWASGLRNPWRMAFDRVTGDLWIGDVGQNRFEEIDVIPAGAGGLDFGWSSFEGFERFGSNDADARDVVFPVLAYAHDAGLGRSVTGGFVYRGEVIAAAYGIYLFADFLSGTLMGWPTSEGDHLVIIGETDMNVSALAETPAGNVLVVDHTGGSVWTLRAK